MKSSVQGFTSRDLIVARWTDSLEDAYVVMRAKDIRHLPVVDDRGTIVGLISDRDMQRAMAIEKSVHEPAETANASFDSKAIVRDFMSWPVETIEESTPIGEAARRMLDKKISALLVTHGGQVVGIMTTEDLLRAVIDLMDTPTQRLQNSVEELVYTSPIGAFAQTLANSGI